MTHNGAARTPENVVITGASQGIGRCIALAHAQRGDHVVLCSRNAESLQRVAEKIVAAGGTAPLVVTADVTDYQSIAGAITQAKDELGRIDRVYCNAGLNSTAVLGGGEESARANGATVATNVTGLLNTAEAALHLFRAQDAGQLVLMSSLSSTRGMAGQFAIYAATKAFVTNLGEGLAMEYAGSKTIGVTTVHPGFVKTQMLDTIPVHPFAVSPERAASLIIKAADARKRYANIPQLPWTLIKPVHRVLPFAIAKRVN